MLLIAASTSARPAIAFLASLSLYSSSYVEYIEPIFVFLLCIKTSTSAASNGICVTADTWETVLRKVLVQTKLLQPWQLISSVQQKNAVNERSIIAVQMRTTTNIHSQELPRLLISGSRAAQH